MRAPTLFALREILPQIAAPSGKRPCSLHWVEPNQGFDGRLTRRGQTFPNAMFPAAPPHRGPAAPTPKPPCGGFSIRLVHLGNVSWRSTISAPGRTAARSRPSCPGDRCPPAMDARKHFRPVGNAPYRFIKRAAAPKVLDPSWWFLLSPLSSYRPHFAGGCAFISGPAIREPTRAKPIGNSLEGGRCNAGLLCRRASLGH